MEETSTAESQLIGKEVLDTLIELTKSFNKVESSGSAFFTYLISYTQSLCDMTLSRVELFTATKSLCSVSGGGIWAPNLLKDFGCLETQLLTVDARLIVTLRSDTERTQIEFSAYIASLKSLFSRRHAALKCCAEMIEERDCKKIQDANRERKRKKKYAGRLQPLAEELKVLTDLLVTSLEDFTSSYLDWFEPLINFVAKLQLHPPSSCLTPYINEFDLEEIHLELQKIGSALNESFERNCDPQLTWNMLRGNMDRFIRFGLTAPYFQKFAEQEHVSESYQFYKSVISFQDSFKDIESSQDANMVAQAKSICSLYLEAGARLEINVPEEVKLATLKQSNSTTFTGHIFDKAISIIKEMLEDTFQHFITSTNAQPLEERLSRIRHHQRRLQSLTKTAEHYTPREVMNSVERDSNGPQIPPTSPRHPLPNYCSSPNLSSGRPYLKKSTSSGHLEMQSQKEIGPFADRSSTGPLPSLNLSHAAAAEQKVYTDQRSRGSSVSSSPSSTASIRPFSDSRDKTAVKSMISNLSQMLGSQYKRKNGMPDTIIEEDAEIPLDPEQIKHLLFLSINLGSLMNDNRTSDFVIYCGNERVPFYVHSIVFTARWPSIFCENPRLRSDVTKGISDASVEFQTVDPIVFSLALEYIYCGKLLQQNFSDQQWNALSEFAKFRKIPGLKDLVGGKRLSKQTTPTIVDALVSYIATAAKQSDGFRIDSDARYDELMTALAQRSAEIVDLDHFTYNNLGLLRRIDMINLLRRDDLAVSSEILLFKLIIKWAEATSKNEDEVGENLSFLVAHLRLPLMTLEELQWIETLGWVPLSLIAEARKYKHTGVCSHPGRSRSRKPPSRPDSFQNGNNLLQYDVHSPNLSPASSKSAASSKSDEKKPPLSKRASTEEHPHNRVRRDSNSLKKEKKPKRSSTADLAEDITSKKAEKVKKSGKSAASDSEPDSQNTLKSRMSAPILNAMKAP